MSWSAGPCASERGDRGRSAWLGTALATAVLGCTASAVPIAARVDAPCLHSAGGTVIDLSVVDGRLPPGARPWTDAISRWGGTADILGSAGSAEQSLRGTLAGALRGCGFEIAAPGASHEATLAVRILTLRRQRLALSIRVVAVLRATASRGALGRVGLYRGEEWRTFAPVDHADPVNAALSRALQSLLEDHALLETLCVP